MDASFIIAVAGLTAGLAGAGVGGWLARERWLERAGRRPVELEMERVEGELVVRREELEGLRKEVAASRAAVAEGWRLKAEVEGMERWREGHRAEFLTFEGEARRLAEVRAELAGLEVRAGELRAGVADLQMKEEGRRRLEQELGVLRQRMVQAEADEGRLGPRVALARADFEAATRRLGEVSAELKEAQGRLAVAVGEEAGCRGRAEGLRREVAALEEAREQLRVRWTELREGQERMGAELGRQWERMEEHLRRYVDVSVRNWTELLRAPEPGEGRGPVVCRDVWPATGLVRPPAPRKGTAAVAVAEAVCLERTGKWLELTGTGMGARGLRAFHTLLKIQDHVPMTLLDGGGGEGLAEAGRRYAEGMGICFLSVPVSGRWTVTDDLLRCYNPMERRYKGTGLAGLLAECGGGTGWERFAAEEWRGRMADRVALALFDGLNRAGDGEGCFGEFLWALEERREVDGEIAAEWAPACFEVEMGSAEAGGYRLGFAPGRNVLFAGTVSGQSRAGDLAEGVRGRSATVRLPRAERLGFAGAGRGRGPVAAVAAGAGAAAAVPGVRNLNVPGLPLEQWLGWQRVAGDLGREQNTVSAWLEQVTGGLREAGRGVGLRFMLGVAAYVANYPKEFSTHWLREALADQLELVALPRLEGVVTAERRTGLETLGRMVQATKDAGLAEAYEVACGGERFRWDGVERR